MNVLAIGNSFSEDATRYLHKIAKASGVKLTVVNLYIGGCPLDKHYRNMLADNKDYALTFNGENTGFKVSIKEALLSRDWDAVTLQQASHLSTKQQTYRPYASELVAYIRKCAPNAKIYVHQTWAYEDGSERLTKLMGYQTSGEMLADIKLAYQAMYEENELDGIIPSGEMLLTLSKSIGAPVHRDTFHASFGIGRYALGLLWFRALCEKSVADNSFCEFDEPICEEYVSKCKECVDTINILRK